MLPWARRTILTRAFVPRVAPPRAVHVLRSWSGGDADGLRRVVGLGISVRGVGEVVWVPEVPGPEAVLEGRLREELKGAVRRLGGGPSIQGCPAYLPGPIPRAPGMLEIVPCAILLRGEMRARAVEVRGGDPKRSRAVALRVRGDEYEVVLVAEETLGGGNELPLLAIRRGLGWPTTSVLWESTSRVGDRFVVVSGT